VYLKGNEAVAASSRIADASAILLLVHSAQGGLPFANQPTALCRRASARLRLPASTVTPSSTALASK
jgi:hypothetical protein